MEKNDLPLVVLRAMEPEDLDLLYTIENDPAMWEVSSGCSPVSKFVLRKYISLQPDEIYSGGELRLVIEDAEQSRAVGLADLTSISLIDGKAEVGIAVLKKEQSKHYGYAALLRLAKYAKMYLKLRFLYAHVSAADNAASVKIFESAGFHQIALLPQWHYRMGKYEDVRLYQKML